MATSSTYIQLSASVLLEYEYRDQGATANQYNVNTIAPWYLMNNEHDDSIAIFNSNDTQVTGNLITKMGTIIDPTLAQYGYLERDLINTLNDYDPLLTNTANLPVGFTATQMVSYDVVRLHLVQGFNFQNKKGFQFNLSYENENDKKVQYLNLAYQDSDNYAQINPDPFIFGGKFYASYIEVKVPNLYNLVDEYWSAIFAGTSTNDLPSYKLSGNAGPKRDSKIQSSFSWIESEKTINGQRYFYSYEFKNIDLPTLDQFSNISAEIEDATDGDYIKLYAAWNGDIIDNFITQLNNVPGNDYIILHELNVFEYIWPAGTGSSTWIKTGGLEFVQDSNYEDPIPYRPIIQNAGSVNFRIDYTVRLYNKEDASSIWKTGSYQSANPAKWAKYLRRITLGSNPIQPKVYNKIVDKNVNFFGSNTSGSDAVSDGPGYTSYVTSFLTTNNVMLSAQNAFIQRNPSTGNVNITSVANSQSEVIYAQGLCNISLTNSDTFIKFVIYKGPNPTEFMALNALGQVYLNFFADSGEINKFKKFNSSDISEDSGEILFKIPAKDSQRISQYSNKSFTITSDNGEAETQLYTGNFIQAGQENDNLLERKIENLKQQLEEMKQMNDNLNDLVSLGESNISTLQTANQEQNTQIQNLQNSLDLQIEENNNLIADDLLDDAERARLQEKVAELNAAKASLAVQLQTSLETQEVQVIDANCPTQYVQPRPINPKREKSSPYNS